MHESHVGVATLPDSFSVRLKLSGTALRDLVMNYPYLFEVSEPDELTGEISNDADSVPIEHQVRLLAPEGSAPALCVIDSGIQEQHPLLRHAIDGATSVCFVPGVAPNDVSDYVSPNGHGTRVAGAVIFSQGIPENGDHQASCWLQNARVLDDYNRLSTNLHPPSYLRAIVERYHHGPASTKLFNHSIAAYRPCKLRQVSAWAAAIDKLSWDHDILIFQSAGNLPDESAALPHRLGIADHIFSGHTYPHYLLRPSSRIPSPSESLQALTVGSISHTNFSHAHLLPFAARDQSSAFTTTGLGVWDTIKPEVVEYGGDLVRDAAARPNIQTHEDVCIELVRTTLHGGPLSSKDDVGTSFAAPKVAAIGVALQALLPDQPALLYRALIVNSARWPDWAERAGDKLGALRQIGYGLPKLSRATENDEYRITFITDGLRTIRAKEAQIFQIPIPAQLRSPGDEFNIRIDVTLSYVAQPQRTRRNARQYLSTWVDWKSSHLGETLDSFKNRALKEGNPKLTRNDGVIPWKIREQDDWGEIAGVRRGIGTVQKDWVEIKSHQLPEDFCVAVVGHTGWDKDPDAFAKYALTVTFEAVDQDIEVYEQIATAVNALISIDEIEEQIQVAQVND